jgi:hypothetical protein
MNLETLLSQIAPGENSTLPLKAVCRYSGRGGQTPTVTDGQEPFCLAVPEAVYV